MMFIARTLLLAAPLALGAGLAAAQVPISELSPNPDGGDPTDPLAVTACNGGPQDGVLFRNSETEPHLAANPTDPNNMIAGWHQDRWSNGAAQSLGVAYTRDGGATWTQVTIPFTNCSGGPAAGGLDFERASDPWITFSPDGTAHYMALVAGNLTNENAMAVASSTDGGETWSAPVIIKGSPAADGTGRSLFHDKNTMTADPANPRFVYATWTVFRTGITAVLTSRSTDGGKTWSAARPSGGLNTTVPAQTVIFRQGAQIAVLPDGTLRNFFYRILFNNRTGTAATEQATFKSTDRGKTWVKQDQTVSPFTQRFASDPETGLPVRDAGPLPDVAVNRTTGELYVVFQDDNGAGQAGVFISRSGDKGATWSTPIPADPGNTGNAQSFLPVVAVNDAGIVGVLFYDFRNDLLGDAPLSTDVWLQTFTPDLATPLSETRLTPTSMDMRQAPITGLRGYFPGDYMGLDTVGTSFAAAFTRMRDAGAPTPFPQPPGLFVDSEDRTNIVFKSVP
jgi:hypothetical protein